MQVSADASSIFESLKHIFKDLDLHELVGFFSNGVSVTTRFKNGVDAKFKLLDETKSLINVHYICDCLTLPYGDTGNDLWKYW